MEVAGANRQIQIQIPSRVPKDCDREWGQNDTEKTLKSPFRVREPSGTSGEKNLPKNRKEPEATVKDCLRPPIPTKFQSLINELKETVKKSYWDKEVGKTIYLQPHLPAGCDPTVTTFGKIGKRDEHGVADLINPREIAIEDRTVHELYQKSHNDYYPSEQINRKYAKPFNKYAAFGDAKKTADFSGKKVARCMKWYTNDPVIFVKRQLAEFSNRTRPRLGKVRNCDEFPVDFASSQNGGGEREEGVSEVLKEGNFCPEDIYQSDYTDKFSKTHDALLAAVKIRCAGIPSERTDLPYVVLPDGASRSDRENLGDQTSVMALVTPNIFTEFGLSHIDFFKVREYEEMRSIFENIGVEFPGRSFDALWQEGLKKDCTGGVCIETFRNLLDRLAENNLNNPVL